ncbi:MULTISPECIES: PASTA domain-containing protein [Streptomyces]|uniref:PASTA domain protein n=1 Tax=Streptomyces chartreusis NRRL 3882 TaxID=1079985 RepID=A0A2N9B4B1_STRCX|nr:MULTISPECIES: PASTA domain-containing protein [Streptomyces]MYS95639.1 PASTA domain-containing protein [Streptomyces sp. SID5464]SOR78177.1 PASTA domain protein [Streptomyces chartreusis NRRL 3882]
MHTQVRTTLAAACLTTLASLSACGGNGTPTDDEPTRTPDTTTSAPADKPTPTPESASLPDMIGKGLQSAQDQAQDAGFYNLTSHDALGRGREQFDDRNWKVCFQAPDPGQHPTNSKVDFATVKLEETCPATDQGTQTETAGASMPDFKGKSVKVAREALPSNASIVVNDASGEGRVIVIESNWKVCSQEPAAGTKLEGQPVTLNAVKFEETC